QGRIIDDSSGQARLGGGRADVLVGIEESQRKVEVKASAREGFSEFVEKDTRADHLVWVHFGDAFLIDSDPIVEVLVVEGPSQFFQARTKMTLPRFKLIVGDRLRSISVGFNSFQGAAAESNAVPDRAGIKDFQDITLFSAGPSNEQSR
ncbi:MAG TPA: hypothetical protein VGZ47_02965, partial [Gemmataceae bacterium]|nr:hypothetical protein [Gemmataceae bacterium]